MLAHAGGPRAREVRAHPSAIQGLPAVSCFGFDIFARAAGRLLWSGCPGAHPAGPPPGQVGSFMSAPLHAHGDSFLEQLHKTCRLRVFLSLQLCSNNLFAACACFSCLGHRDAFRSFFDGALFPDLITSLLCHSPLGIRPGLVTNVSRNPVYTVAFVFRQLYLL